MAHQVFLSHATEDRETASRVCAALEADGISCWIAPRDVKAGTDYAAAILDAIRTSDLVLLIFSTFADSSPYVLREIERAVAYKRPVLALRIDDVVPSASIEYYVNVWRRFDATTGVEKKQEEIITAVREAIAAPTSGGGSRPRDAKRATTLGLWSRRKWWIALGSLLVIAAVGLGLGFGLTRDHAASGAGLMRDQVTWTKPNPPGALPLARATQEMVQDPTSGRLIMFGGYAGKDGGAALNDTWAYDPAANTWMELRPSGALPSARAACSMAYDPATRRLIMFGGRDDTGTRLNDTWAYDPAANSWSELRPSGTLPLGRAGHVMAYDPSGGRLIVFGGRSSETDLLSDTWAYDPATNGWTELMPSGNLPPARAQPAMAYDPAAHRLIMFGGWDLDTDFGDTWAYDPSANTWADLDPSGTVPPARSGHDLAYDSSAGLLIMFGGVAGENHYNDTWKYDAAVNTWTRFYVFQGAAPAPRTGQSMVYNPSTDRLIMFGGAPTGPYDLNDTWACALSRSDD
jgi:N-acetylneuraminic acid mutarotase